MNKNLQKLKKWWKNICVSIDDFLGNPMLFAYQKTLLKLFGLLLIAIFFVIRGSTAPLIFDGKLMRFLFYSDPAADKSIYNIAISVIAAFVFYVFQVYIPERKKYRRICSAFWEPHQHIIFLLNQYTLAWDKFLDEQSGQCNFVQFSYTLSPRGSYVLTQASYEETIEALPDDFLLIMKSPTFSDCDIAYQSFIIKSYYLIVGHLRFMDDQFPHWSNTPLDAKDHKLIKSLVMDDMKRIQRRMSSLTKYKLTVIETSPYTGKSLLELLEEDKHNTQE